LPQQEATFKYWSKASAAKIVFVFILIFVTQVLQIYFVTDESRQENRQTFSSSLQKNYTCNKT